MNWNILLKGAEAVLGWFWSSCEVKVFVVKLLERYSGSTDNDIDDAVVEMVRKDLLKNCPQK
jgi:hypothetical protein